MIPRPGAGVSLIAWNGKVCVPRTAVSCASRPGHPPADLIRQREMKWVEMTSHWEKTMSRRYKKVRVPLPLPPQWAPGQ